MHYRRGGGFIPTSFVRGRAAPRPSRAEMEDLLRRDAQRPTAADPFPVTQILPRTRS